ncbi:MAG: hypothetical protein ACRDSF_18350 [Pseudonocardiaceae bacterium]
MEYRVAQLNYTVVWLDDARRVRDNAPPVSVKLAGFDCHLHGAELVARPEDDYGDEYAARAALEPVLQGWEANSEVMNDLPFRFEFSGSRLELAAPQSVGTQAFAEVALAIAAALDATAHILHGEFPKPDPTIAIEGPVTAQLRSRWRQMRQGREPLTSFAYWAFTKIRSEFDSGSAKAGSILNISGPVLRKLSELSTVPDPKLGRKAEAQGRKLTDRELAWLKAVLPALIRRVMERENGFVNAQQITMADLPTL